MVRRREFERAAVPGELNLAALLRDSKPEIHKGVFVFCTIADGADISPALRPLLTFREREGMTLVLRREDAERADLSYQFASRQITLTVHSSLDAVGFLAAITARLAEAGIAVNAVSAFHHDHLFVPEHRAEEALAILKDMSTPNSG
jgi:hypothetical protein